MGRFGGRVDLLVLLGSCRSVWGLGDRREGCCRMKTPLRPVSHQDLTTVCMSSQGDERTANIKAAWVICGKKHFRYILFFSQDWVLQGIALCVLCLWGGACAFQNFDSVRVVISFKARTKTDVINTLAMSKTFKVTLKDTRFLWWKTPHIFFFLHYTIIAWIIRGPKGHFYIKCSVSTNLSGTKPLLKTGLRCQAIRTRKKFEGKAQHDLSQQAANQGTGLRCCGWGL